MKETTRRKMESMEEFLGVKVHLYEKTDSTNKRAKEYAKELIANKNTSRINDIFVADQQTEGRGRLGRNWQSPPETGIWMSLLTNPNVPAESISSVTLLAAMAIARGVKFYSLKRSIFNIDAKIKWPNDIIINGKKICGILSELVTDPDTGMNYVICGIGVNVNTRSFEGVGIEYASSLYKESGVTWDREELAYGIIYNIKELMRSFELEKALGFMIEDYNRVLVNMDQEVILSSVNPEIQSGLEPRYIARGIDKTGALLVENSKGEIIPITSGEVSVRGLYGYT
ncbi:BirA family transcriptional regulator, biotin operon repressor / biotin-[acetyl-CoA-carboxylase] ligase [Lachnospiraceae bacterium NE2001]|nr:BirA family transcriptional regulator, biotin operon repressor / biotin-[acetyl-CoA-carboxylase] ligase [Lachnospiraceae bacterium NE2001]